MDASHGDAVSNIAEQPEFKRPAPVPGPYLPLTRTFRAALPSIAGHYPAVEGWDERVWFLSEGKLLEHDGTKVVSTVTLCDFPTGPDTRTTLTSLPDGVLANQFELGELGVFTQLNKDGKTCHQANDPNFELQLAMKLRARALGVYIPRSPEKLLGVPFPPLPPEQKFGAAALYTVGSARWLQVQVWPEPRTFRATDKGWLRDEPPIRSIGGMWADPTGTVWAIIGFYSGVLQSNSSLDPGFLLGKHDGTRWSVVPVPEDFRPRHITGSSATDIWFVGNSEHILQFDGTNWHRGTIAAPKREVLTVDGRKMVDSPEGPRDIHMTASGVLWLLTSTGRIYRAEP